MTPESFVSRVYDILVKECGAAESERPQFLAVFPCDEYRFRGNLGFGGKLYWRSNGSLYVDGYLEDMNMERVNRILRVNKLLKSLYE